MASVNKVHLLGNIGRDLELRYLPNGDASAGTSLATSSKRKDKNTGEVIEDTQWHRIQFFGKTAEIAAQYLRKGSPVYVEGRLKYGKYTDKDGVEKATCDIIVSEMQLLGSKDGAPQQQAPQQGYQQQPQRQAAPQQKRPPQSAPPQRQAPARAPSGGFEDMDDDIPFVNAMRGSARCLAM